MKLKPEIWNIILIAGLIALTVFTIVDKINSNAELKALENGYELLDKTLEKSKAKNEQDILKLQDSIQAYDEYLKKLNSSLEKIEKNIDAINKTSNEKKATIDGVTDADVLTDILTGRYR